jgi:hypothetical protein
MKQDHKPYSLPQNSALSILLLSEACNKITPPSKPFYFSLCPFLEDLALKQKFSIWSCTLAG